jgi:dihydroorotase
MKRVVVLLVAVALVAVAGAQTNYDLLLKGGHVIDARNGLSAVRDVAISGGKIAAVAQNIPASAAQRTVNVAGLYVTPGLVDIHVHVYTGERTATYAGGDLSVPPDDFTLRTCVTTVADAGSSGWRTFEDFKRRVIDRSKTRVTAFLNIVGVGMREGQLEQNLDDMDVAATAAMAMKHKGVVVGIKSAHFAGPEWTPYEKAVAVGRQAGIPVMVDFGANVRNGRTIMELFTKHFRPGDIFTHMYGGVRGEQDQATRGPSAAFIEGRKRGVMLDVGHGGGSFRWSAAIPMMKAGFVPDSISTDLHTSSSQSGMKDMLDVMSKFLAMGRTVDDVIRWSTVNPARQIQMTDLGHLSVGAPADVAVLRVDKGAFGFVDQVGARVDGTQRFGCEITLRNGTMVYDGNGRTRDAFDPNAPLPVPGGGGGNRGRGAAPPAGPTQAPGRQ